MTPMDEARLRGAAEEMRRLALAAGSEAMRYFGGSSLEVETKLDDTPVTAADKAADALIVDGLRAAHPEIAVVSEESVISPEARSARRFFLVDPLDGTKSFISGDGDFTVNIALIEDGAPRLGVVYAPVSQRLFWTPDPDFAVHEALDAAVAAEPERLWVGQADPAKLRVVASKNHRTPETDAYIRKLGAAEIRDVGSSLKLCLIASGEADIYPRIGPTMIWDIAAAHAVLGASGGRVEELGADGRRLGPLTYSVNKPRNPSFVAFAPGVTIP